MAVGIVAGDAIIQPDCFAHSQIIGKNALQASSVKAGITRLHRAKQALFCGEHGAVAVDVYTAAFEDNAVLLALNHGNGLPGGKLQQPGNVGGKACVLLPVGILGPRIEVPVGEGQRTRKVAEFGAFRWPSQALAGRVVIAPDENRSGVAGPHAVCAPAVK